MHASECIRKFIGVDIWFGYMCESLVMKLNRTSKVACYFLNSHENSFKGIKSPHFYRVKSFENENECWAQPRSNLICLRWLREEIESMEKTSIQHLFDRLNEIIQRLHAHCEFLVRGNTKEVTNDGHRCGDIYSSREHVFSNPEYCIEESTD